MRSALDLTGPHLKSSGPRFKYEVARTGFHTVKSGVNTADSDCSSQECSRPFKLTGTTMKCTVAIMMCVVLIWTGSTSCFSCPITTDLQFRKCWIVQLPIAAVLSHLAFYFILTFVRPCGRRPHGRHRPTGLRPVGLCSRIVWPSMRPLEGASYLARLSVIRLSEGPFKALHWAVLKYFLF